MSGFRFSDFSGVYLEQIFLQHINQEQIKTIVELGARDLRDTIELARHYKNAKVFAFECNPDTIPICQHNLSLVEPDTRERIIFVPYAVGAEQSSKKFYKFVAENNPGASSFFPRIYDKFKQAETEHEIRMVTVEQILEVYGAETVDLVCADIQGYEIEALRGFGRYLENVKYILTEVPKDRSLYENAPTRKEMESFFEIVGFNTIQVAQENLYEDNILLRNKNI